MKKIVPLRAWNYRMDARRTAFYRKGVEYNVANDVAAAAEKAAAVPPSTSDDPGE